MSNLYSVLDQIYYFLYCHFQNDENVSYSNDAFNIKQPIKLTLKRSEDEMRDQLPECKKIRNDWITEESKKIFGGFNFPKSQRRAARCFQDNLLRLQAIREVDRAGKEVPGPNGGPKLLRVVLIEHDDAKDIEKDAEGTLPPFNPEFKPISLEVEDLTSVADPGWNDTVEFNLLHFFRNFTAHRSLIACKIRKGYLNLQTREFQPPPEPKSNLSYPWIFIAKGSWILVPELSHLRQAERESPPKFHSRQLSVVCSRLLEFVKTQRHNVLLVLDHKEDYPYVVNWSWDGFIKFTKNNQYLGKCEWQEARLWPVVPETLSTTTGATTTAYRKHIFCSGHAQKLNN